MRMAKVTPPCRDNMVGSARHFYSWLPIYIPSIGCLHSPCQSWTEQHTDAASVGNHCTPHLQIRWLGVSLQRWAACAQETDDVGVHAQLALQVDLLLELLQRLEIQLCTCTATCL